MRIDRVLISPWIVVIIVVLNFTTNCDDQNEFVNYDDRIGFRFGMRGDSTRSEDFIAVTRDYEIIASAREQLLLPVSERTLHIHGVVTSGNGDHNLDWSWHFIPTDWVLVEASIEVCDVSPSAISTWLENLPDTLNTIPNLILKQV